MEDGFFYMQRYWGSDDEVEKSERSKSFEDRLKRKRKKDKSGLEDNVGDRDLVNGAPIKVESDHENSIKKFKYDSPQENDVNESCLVIEQHGNFSKKVESQENHSVSRYSDLIKKEKNKASDSEKTAFSSPETNNNQNSIVEEGDSTNYTNKDDSSKKVKLKEKRAKKQKEKKDIKSFKVTTDVNFLPIGQVKDLNSIKIKPSLPKWLSSPSLISNNLHEENTPVSDFSYFDETTKKNLKHAGIEYLFPVQLTVIPWLLSNNLSSLTTRPSDLCVSAPTGSGKTLAFVLPIVQSLKNRIVRAIRALIVLPVSDLAFQVYEAFEIFTKGTDLKVALLTGQKSFINEQQALVKLGIKRMHSLVDIVVTTPGRVLDHISRTAGFSLEKLRYLVIDEADRFMDEIQKGWLKKVEDAVFKNGKQLSCTCFTHNTERKLSSLSSACDFANVQQPLQKLLYSATLSYDPEKLHTLTLYKPKLFATQSGNDAWIGKCQIPEDLHIRCILCDNGTKPMVLCHLIKTENFKKVLCFTESVDRAQRLNLVLSEMGFLEVREFSSINRPVQRKIILEQFSAGKFNVLVCSAIMARGMDIDDVDCVISYDISPFMKPYIHRIGRTARAGKKGTAIALITSEEVSTFKKLHKAAGILIPNQEIFDSKYLESYVTSFQNALQATNMTLKKRNFKSKKMSQRKLGKK